MESKSLFIAGTMPFIILGAIHIVYTLIDIRTPWKLAPYKDEVRISMLDSTLKLTKQTNMWRAWLGFNISHGMGVFIFGLVYLMLAESDFGILLKITPLLYLAPLVAFCYLILSIKYWFNIPVIGASIGLGFFVAAVLLS
jgi:hypothetical protein